MKRILLSLSMMCFLAVFANADRNSTNFYSYNFATLHQKYYNQTNCFYVAPLVYYISSEGTLAVAGADMNETSIEIPSQVTFEGKTYPVTAIHGYAFQRCGNLTTLTIPSSVNYIYTSTLKNKTVFYSGPFAGCRNLKTINDNAMKAQGFWNKDAKGSTIFKELPAGVVINTPDGSDYTAWAKYVDGLGLSVSVSASGFGSFFVDKDLEVPSNVSAIYMVTGTETDAAFTKLQGNFIPANTAFIVAGQSGSAVTFRTTTIPKDVEVDVASNKLQGSMEDQKVNDNNKFLILSTKIAANADNLPSFETAGSVLAKNQAYLPVLTTMQRAAFGTATGIKSNQVDKENGTFYDLQGMPVTDLSKAKGIYLKKGNAKYYK